MAPLLHGERGKGYKGTIIRPSLLDTSLSGPAASLKLKRDLGASHFECWRKEKVSEVSIDTLDRIERTFSNRAALFFVSYIGQPICKPL